MKSKLLLVALIGVLLAVAMVSVSCKFGCEGAGTCKLEVVGMETTTKFDYYGNKSTSTKPILKGSSCTNEDYDINHTTGIYTITGCMADFNNDMLNDKLKEGDKAKCDC